MTAADLIRIVVALFFILVGCGVYRWLLPRLSRTAKLVAHLTLAAQVFALGVALFIEPASSADERLWHLDREWNIPSTLASTQLALVGGVALMSAWLSRAQPAWKRLYYLGIALVFLLLAYDEYFEAHEFTTGWAANFTMLGGIVVAATLLVMWRSPRHSWIWHLSFLAGLALCAGGGLLIETQCFRPVFAAIGHCDKHYWLEEPLEFLGGWLALVAMLGQFSRLSPSSRIQRWLVVFPALWLLMLSLPEAIDHIERYTTRAKPAAVAFESGMHLRGYFSESLPPFRWDERGDLDGARLHLFFSPTRLDVDGMGFAELGYSIHVIDQENGDSVHKRDKYAHRRHLLAGPGAWLTYRQGFDLRLPQLQSNRAFWIVLSLWRNVDGAYFKDKILKSDHHLLSETQVVLDEFVVPAAASDAPRDPIAHFDNGFILESVGLPEAARRGEDLPIVFGWRSEADGRIDHAQFLHLGHMESGEWTVFDGPPLGPRLPTRLWYDGLADSESWHVPLPAEMAPGRYALFSGLYRESDKERVPAKSGEGVYFLDARVPLGSLQIE